MEGKVFSEKNVDSAMEVARDIYTSDFTVHDGWGDHKGLDALAEGLRYTQADFLDWKENAVSIVAEGDYIAARLISGETQARDFEAVPHISPVIPNKHRPLRLQEMVIFRVVDGKLAKQWAINDGWDAYIQLGLFDPITGKVGLPRDHQVLTQVHNIARSTKSSSVHLIFLTWISWPSAR